MPKRSLQVYFITHADGRRSGMLLRRWDAFFDKPAPAAYGRDEEDVLQQLAVQLAERAADNDPLSRYLWDESFDVRRADVTTHPMTLVKKRPVIGKKRVPLKLTYVAVKLSSGAYRVMLPRFGWWLLVEDLEVAAETLRNAVSGALLGEEPAWLYDFRREGDEYVRPWLPEFLRDGAEGTAAGDDDEDDDDYPTLRAVAEELVEKAARRRMPTIIGEWPEEQRFQELAETYPPPSVLLVGESGAGKTTSVWRLARLIARLRKGAGRAGADALPRIWRSSGERIVAGMIYLGMWQERVFELVEELQHEGDWLYLDRLHTVLAPQPDGASIADLLTPAVLAGEISLLAECTEAELERHRREAPRLVDALEIVRVPAADAAVMPKLMSAYNERRGSGVTLHAGGLGRLVQYLDTFSRGAGFPGKGFHFLDWLGQQEDLKKQSVLYPRLAAEAFGRYSGLPVSLLADDELLPAEAVAQELRRRVVGQDAACETCARVVTRLKARLNDPERPVGTLLFVGPTGVGKTELAKQLTRYLFGDEQRMIRLDMSEFMAGQAFRRMLEVRDNSGSLASKVRAQPLSVVLLDEIEKAHPQVFDLLLGVLGEGRLTDAAGRLVDFRMTLIIMTSNLGAGEGTPVGFGEGGEPDFLGRVRKHFRPEFFNRLDHVVTFGRLEPADIETIVDLELAKATARTGLRRRGIRLQVEPAARKLLAELGWHPTRGARPLKRVIEERVVTPLAVLLARRPELEGCVVRVVVRAEGAADRGELTIPI
jgi:ATP-dependent Clp protease ATP-binding subunit ClpC